MFMTDSASQDLVVVRHFDAPRAAVWKAWTDPEQLKKWWSPKDCTTPSVTIDVKVGGKLLFCMSMPDGKEVWGTGTFKEVVPMEKLVYADNFADKDGNIVSADTYGMPADFPKDLIVTVVFEDDGQGTKMTLTHSGMPAGKMKDMTGDGWNEMFDKMGEIIQK
jgi:uncharacterized protein YndB with AHSA1/START domain